MKRRLVAFANTGVTVLKVTAPDDSAEFRQGKSFVEGIRVKGEEWDADQVDGWGDGIRI